MAKQNLEKLVKVLQKEFPNKWDLDIDKNDKDALNSLNCLKRTSKNYEEDTLELKDGLKVVMIKETETFCMGRYASAYVASDLYSIRIMKGKKTLITFDGKKAERIYENINDMIKRFDAYDSRPSSD